jgi:hypothetical protein
VFVELLFDPTSALAINHNTGYPASDLSMGIVALIQGFDVNARKAHQRIPYSDGVQANMVPTRPSRNKPLSARWTHPENLSESLFHLRKIPHLAWSYVDLYPFTCHRQRHTITNEDRPSRSRYRDRILVLADGYVLPR